VASTLIIPGVQVRTLFEPSPVLPGATGVLGVVGIADRGPVEPTPLGNVAELIDQFGPASRYTMPEIRTAFTNGVARVWVSRIAPGRGKKASVTVADFDGEPSVVFTARAEGAWGNELAVTVKPVAPLSGPGAKYVDLEILLGGVVIERIDNLVADPDSPNDLFARVNSQSKLIVATDPVFGVALPATIAQTALDDAEARPASAVIKAGAADAVVITAKRAGAAGNLISVQLVAAPAAFALKGATGPSVDVSTRKARTDGTGFGVTVQPSGADSVTLTVTPPAGAAPRTYGPADSVDALVTAAAGDPDVLVSATGTQLPAPIGQQKLQPRVDVVVFTEGREPRVYPGIGSVEALAAITDPAITFGAAAPAQPLPAPDAGTALTGGRNKGPALALGANPGPGVPPLLELVPAPKTSGALSVSVTQHTSTLDGATAVVDLDVFADGAKVESYTNLTLDPDDQRYVPAVLADGSKVLRAKDLIVRSRTSSLPSGLKTYKLAGGIAPSVDDYQDSLDRLEMAEEVDLVIASAAAELGSDGVRAVHQAVVAHCTKMSDVARNRIGLGSVTPDESSVNAVLSHADDVRSDHFVLVAPAGLDAALAGLLGHQDYFESPTFKTIASPGATPGSYTDAQLEQLIGGNVTVVNQRRRRGVIVVKGLLTSGMQINVRRTANKAVRDVHALAERYIGLLNNEGNRRALLGQVTAMLGQMERDGALVPSTDGADPAFLASVYSSQNDAALGIVRIDIAVRPVRAIDYVYATILVKN
jgi:hypothetical protein